MRKKKLPIGLDDFSKLIKDDFYYVDKTGMIRDILNNWGEVNLFTRPRRFGKSLNMSMLKNFFETGADETLFEGLEISKETELCKEYMGKYPVIFVSFKSAHGSTYEKAISQLCTIIGMEALRFDFLLDSPNLSDYEKSMYRQLVCVDKNGGDSVFVMPETVLKASLSTLSKLLYKHYGEKVIILIDEYDVPLAKAKENDFYKKMVEIIRAMFDVALKSNESLKFAVLTGCLRVSKESIFTGLNNPKMYTLLDPRCEEYFGFTDNEVCDMLAYYDLTEYYDVTKEWYDGYLVSNTNVYNPWDVLNYCEQLRGSQNKTTDKTPKSYWTNSSGNADLRKFISRMGNDLTKAQLERLISGESVQKKIEEQLTYDTMYDDIENMWSLLFATGYLTPSEPPQGNIARLVIPNTEVRYIFADQILKMFQEETAKDGELTEAFCTALKTGDTARIEQLFTAFMGKTISVRDTAVQKEFKENFYHGILIGILAYKNGWSVESNRESGDGYFDIAIEIEDESIGIIIEVKYAEDEKFDESCVAALKQINKNGYTAELKKDDMENILKYGIACYKKKCKVVLERE